MTMAPYARTRRRRGRTLARLREVLEDVQTERILGPEFRELSMGMSNDFEVAIEEVPLVRVGNIPVRGATIGAGAGLVAAPVSRTRNAERTAGLCPAFF